jgi:hypothetical protein|tara:strand:+ start:2288 stop:2467 length:180 start_codon:yes stop_codon:yes gene_type:complete
MNNIQSILEYIDHDVPHDASHGYHWRKVREMVQRLDTSEAELFKRVVQIPGALGNGKEK